MKEHRVSARSWFRQFGLAGVFVALALTLVPVKPAQAGFFGDLWDCLKGVPGVLEDTAKITEDGIETAACVEEVINGDALLIAEFAVLGGLAIAGDLGPGIPTSDQIIQSLNGDAKAALIAVLQPIPLLGGFAQQLADGAGSQFSVTDIPEMQCAIKMVGAVGDVKVLMEDIASKAKSCSNFACDVSFGLFGCPDPPPAPQDLMCQTPCGPNQQCASTFGGPNTNDTCESCLAVLGSAISDQPGCSCAAGLTATTYVLYGHTILKSCDCAGTDGGPQQTASGCQCLGNTVLGGLPGSPSCYTCDAAQYPDPTHTTCLFCQAGSGLNDDKSGCVQCQNASGAVDRGGVCLADCTGGMIPVSRTLDYGATKFTYSECKCPPGQRADVGGQCQMIPTCGDGMHLDQQTIKCVPDCPQGDVKLTYEQYVGSSPTGLEVYICCPSVGYALSDTNPPYCQQCDPIKQVSGAYCDDCPPGTQNDGNNNCGSICGIPGTLSSAGTNLFFNTGSNQCTPCTNGTIRWTLTSIGDGLSGPVVYAPTCTCNVPGQVPSADGVCGKPNPPCTDPTCTSSLTLSLPPCVPPAGSPAAGNDNGPCVPAELFQIPTGDNSQPFWSPRFETKQAFFTYLMGLGSPTFDFTVLRQAPRLVRYAPKKPGIPREPKPLVPLVQLLQELSQPAAVVPTADKQCFKGYTMMPDGTCCADRLVSADKQSCRTGQAPPSSCRPGQPRAARGICVAAVPVPLPQCLAPAFVVNGMCCPSRQAYARRECGAWVQTLPLPTCPADMRWDAASNACVAKLVPQQTCPPNMHWDPVSHVCIVELKAKCEPPAFVINGMCCPSRQDYDRGACGGHPTTCTPPNRLVNGLCCTPADQRPGGKCSLPKPPPPPPPCPSGQARDASGKCQAASKPLCPIGQARDARGNCEVIKKPTKCEGRMLRGRCITTPGKPKKLEVKPKKPPPERKPYVTPKKPTRATSNPRKPKVTSTPKRCPRGKPRC